MSIEEKLKYIYALELNAKISWFWDGGFDAALGDDVNGWKDSGNFETLEQAADWLLKRAVQFANDFEAGTSG